MIQLGIKILGLFHQPGHRFTGTRIGCRNCGAGWDFVYVAVDDAKRLTYVEVLSDERKEPATAFLLRALQWFRSQGIHAQPVMTDKEAAYRSLRFEKAQLWLGHTAHLYPAIHAEDKWKTRTIHAAPPA